MKSQNISENSNIQTQKIILVVGILLFIIKIFAWYITNSVSILTDALESIVNIVSGFIGLYSIYLSAQPKDANHPYGHGKVEYISSSIEGSLIFFAGIMICYESVSSFRNGHTLEKIDYGIILILVTAMINYFLGYVAIKKGEKTNSLALISSGKHLQSDTYSTLGIIIGLFLIYFTKIPLIDNITAIIFAIIIMITGGKIIRESIAGIMDEADEELLKEFVDFLNNERTENQIDIHELRIIKYGTTLHLDLHTTVPWYFTVRQAHHEIKDLENKIKDKFGNTVEMFIHTDNCKTFHCKNCIKNDCEKREEAFSEKIEWTLKDIIRA
ncbi:MAG: cation diffusion facilitator family transporter [Candidatus Sericytochromatia bacterium]